jgi:hypothetical protein
MPVWSTAGDAVTKQCIPDRVAHNHISAYPRLSGPCSGWARIGLRGPLWGTAGASGGGGARCERSRRTRARVCVRRAAVRRAARACPDRTLPKSDTRSQCNRAGVRQGAGLGKGPGWARHTRCLYSKPTRHVVTHLSKPSPPARRATPPPRSQEPPVPPHSLRLRRGRWSACARRRAGSCVLLGKTTRKEPSSSPQHGTRD